jgi:outer membrane lipoprotein-sorting protein
VFAEHCYIPTHMKNCILVIFFLSSHFVLAIQSKPINSKPKESITSQILKKYSKSAGVRIDFSKTDFKKTIGIKKISQGQLQYSAGKINVLTTGEKKVEIIYNGKNLWVIEYPDLDFNPKAQRKVTEIFDQKPALAQQIVSLFQDSAEFLKNFKILSDKKDGKMQTVMFESKDKSIQNFQVEFNTSKMLINSIEFTDDVQTLTHIEFKQTEFLKKSPENIFEYKRLKNDEVM